MIAFQYYYDMLKFNKVFIFNNNSVVTHFHKWLISFMSGNWNFLKEKEMHSSLIFFSNGENDRRTDMKTIYLSW